MDDSSTSTSSQSTQEEAQLKKHPNSKKIDVSSSFNSSDSSEEEVQPEKHANSKEMDVSSSLSSSYSSDEETQPEKERKNRTMDESIASTSSPSSEEDAQPGKNSNSQAKDKPASSTSSQSSQEPQQEQPKTNNGRPGPSKSKSKEYPLETVTLKENSLLKAIELIRNKKTDVKTSPLDYFCPVRKVRMNSLCCRNAATILRHRSRNAIPTNLQLLLYHLHKSIYRHEWPSAARCVVYLLKMNGKLLPVIYKSVILILLCHPGATKQHLTDFCQMLLSLRTKYEQEQFIQEILTLPDALPKCKMPKNYQNLEAEDVEVDEDNPLNDILEQLL